VRVNRLSLCLLRLFGEGLPEVLRTNIMAKIGCSADWEWHGYETSTVDVNGQKISSVSGGSHWGGGLRISTRDHARVAEMVLGRGCYGNERIISEDWISQMLTPSRHNKNYGLLWWLNSDGSLYPDAPKTSVFALGGGSNLIWIDPPTGLLAVVRWINKPDVSAFIRNVTMSIRPV
jgi:CubicO group peptidase (beta-lactamase class C family)